MMTRHRRLHRTRLKVMMNGGPTVGAGATVEIAEAAGEENVFLFGLSAEQVAGSRGWCTTRPGTTRPRPGKPST